MLERRGVAERRRMELPPHGTAGRGGGCATRATRRAESHPQRECALSDRTPAVRPATGRIRRRPGVLRSQVPRSRPRSMGTRARGAGHSHRSRLPAPSARETAVRGVRRMPALRRGEPRAVLVCLHPSAEHARRYGRCHPRRGTGAPMTNAFERDGILFPIRVLDEEDLAGARAEVARLEAVHGGVLKRFDRAHLFFRWAYELARKPRVVDAVAGFLGDDIVVWGSLILSKPPYDPGFVAWHQDGAYAGFLGDAPAVSAWIALSDSTIESGCMRVVPGSHRQRLADAEKNAPLNMLSHGQEIAAEVDEREAVDVQLRAGEMSLHHVDIIHGSNANRSAG